MFLALWEFDVKPGFESRFEKVYGLDGDWAQFFRGDPHYRETRLLRDALRPNAYVTLDLWDSRDAYEHFRQQNREAYPALDRSCEAMTLREKHLGSFDEVS
jgi:heme-degrading monooxygenase HmoA